MSWPARKETKMPFGKHWGKPITDVPKDYLNWLLTRDVSAGLAVAVHETLFPDCDLWGELDKALAKCKPRSGTELRNKAVEFVRSRGDDFCRWVLHKGPKETIPWKRLQAEAKHGGIEVVKRKTPLQVWESLAAALAEHKKKHPMFRLERCEEYIKSRGLSYARYVLSRGVEVATKAIRNEGIGERMS